MTPGAKIFCPVEQHLAFDPYAVDEVIHTVETTQERRLAAAAGTDEGRHEAFGNGEINVAQSLFLTVIEVQTLDLQAVARLGRPLGRDLVLAQRTLDIDAMASRGRVWGRLSLHGVDFTFRFRLHCTFLEAGCEW